MFNTLNTIRYFVRTNPETARRLLLNLSEIFQRALRTGEFTPLRDELRYAEAYLTIEKARLDDRLQVDWRIPEKGSDLMEFLVPTLILQPIVENAVIHGIAPKLEGGCLSIEIQPLGDDIMLTVADNGLGFDPAPRPDSLGPQKNSRKAIGITNVDQRLRSLYGDEYHLLIESHPGSGTRVEIRIPYDNNQ